MSRYFLLFSVLGALISCGESDVSSAPESPEAAANLSVHINVHPNTDLYDRADFLPQQFSVNPSDFADLVLDTPVLFDGRVSAWKSSPWLDPSLPSELLLIDAQVKLSSTRSVQGRLASSATSTGEFSLWAVPSDDYLIEIIPNTSGIPIYSQHIALLDDQFLDQVIPLGAPLWGQITDATGQGIPSARVHYLTQNDTDSVSVITDESGFFELRVQPGRVRLVIEQRGDQPAITTDYFELTEAGLRVDRQLGPATPITLRGSVLLDGRAQSGTQLNLHATSLDGYNSEASFQATIYTDNAGRFEVTLPAGVYTLAAQSSASYSPVALSALQLHASQALPDLNLAPFFLMEGTVLGPNGAPLADAIVSAKEAGFSEREWSTTSDILGAFSLNVPRTDLRFTVLPADSDRTLVRTQRAVSRESLAEPLTLIMNTGPTLSGQARGFNPNTGEPQPIAFSFIEVKRDNGESLGSTLTDDAGFFALNLPL